MENEQDPGDALCKLLAERERAKRSVYAANIAREKAEEETAHVDKLFKMQIEEGQKLAAENADLRSKLEQSDKSMVSIAERAEKEQERADNAERREKILENILNRIEDELHDAILGEDDFTPLDDIAAPPHDPTVDTFDYSEDEANEVVAPTSPEWRMGAFRAARFARGLSCRARFYLVATVSAPFLLMLAAMALASQGVYIDALRLLWTDAVADEVKVTAGLLVPGSLLMAWYLTCGASHRIDSKANVPTTEQREETVVEKKVAEKTDDAEYIAALKEIFGEEDSDEREAEN